MHCYLCEFYSVLGNTACPVNLIILFNVRSHKSFDALTDSIQEMPSPQAFVSEFAPRLRGHLNSLLTPVAPPTNAQVAPTSRTTKRGTVVINYSEDLLADDDFEDSDGPRRHTGLRSRREVDPIQSRDTLIERLKKDPTAPVGVQGIWRDWMGKPKFGKYEVVCSQGTANTGSANIVQD